MKVCDCTSFSILLRQYQLQIGLAFDGNMCSDSPDNAFINYNHISTHYIACRHDFDNFDSDR